MFGKTPPGKLHRYLRTSLLRPGDVLLTRGGGWQSKAIALLTLGQFSHAALVCREGVLLESDDDGVGLDIIRPLNVKLVGRWTEWGRLSHGYHALRVFRHPGMEPVVNQFGNQRIKETYWRYFGEPYSYVERLASAIPWLPKSAVPVAAKLMRLGEDRRYFPGLQGVFCSELIVNVFRDLGLQLFRSNLSPNAVSPNHLARSRLRHVHNVVVPLRTVEAARQMNPDLDTRGGVFPRKQLLRRMTLMREMDALLDEFNEIDQEIRRLRNPGPS